MLSAARTKLIRQRVAVRQPGRKALSEVFLASGECSGAALSNPCAQTDRQRPSFVNPSFIAAKFSMDGPRVAVGEALLKAPQRVVERNQWLAASSCGPSFNKNQAWRLQCTQGVRKRRFRLARFSSAYWRVTFDNPPLNPQFVRELGEIIKDVEADRTSGSWSSTAPLKDFS